MYKMSNLNLKQIKWQISFKVVLQGVVVRNGHEGFLEADEEKVLDLSDGGR